MKTLLALVNEQRSQLQEEIDKAKSIEEVITLLQNRLDNLERNYTGQLNISQVRLVSFFLDALRQSIASLAATQLSQKLLNQSQPVVNSTFKLPSNELILKGLQGLICIGIISSLLSLNKIPAGAWMAILLTVVLVGIETVLLLDKFNRPVDEKTEPNQVLEVPKPVLEINSQILLDHLADALNTIDHAVISVQGTKLENNSGLEELPELLNFLQRLMGANFLERPQMSLELIKLLPQILRQQGIYAQIYHPNDPQSERSHFDFEPSIDHSTQEYITLSPALLKGDRLLRRGRVIEPVSQQ
ncbi:conserved hypothetical protein [Gloeothece citriformis PCC 7424]|uniref:Uncharacterized protein n=1 Tax=Gloeothece citriformis (strain PCC 7424) TaxID=65393 RepID=B7KDX5_GLOC7|nr:hypothetical protein [Gloeothece citriformis]ACK71673.1 conserved hypothetical protein [Gloeothece citriformis PCC 7424]